MTAQDLLTTLQEWRTRGWLRPLDVALARFVHEQSPTAPASLLLAAALLARQEGRGHTALPLEGLSRHDVTVLDWPAEGQEALQAVLHVWPADAQARTDAWQGLWAVTLVQTSEAGTAAAVAAAQGASPLVVNADRMYLRRYWNLENQVAAQIKRRAADGLGGNAGVWTMPTSAVAQALDRLFPPLDPLSGPDAQRLACSRAAQGRLTVVTGGPGTGKTYTAARILVLWQSLHTGPQALRVALAAPTGKAAARLKQSIDDALANLPPDLAASVGRDRWAPTLPPACTLHTLLGVLPGSPQPRHHAANPLEIDALLVDEASMIHLEMMAQLLDALPPTTRLVLLGDKDQLSSVEAGSVMADLCHAADAELVQASSPLAQQTVVLRRSRRFDGPIGQLAQAVNQGQVRRVQDLLGRGTAEQGERAIQRLQPTAFGDIQTLIVDGRDGVPGFGHYLEVLAQRPGGDSADDPLVFQAWASRVITAFDQFRVLCAVRAGVWGVAGMNLAIEKALRDRQRLPTGGEWYEGRPVLVTQNDRDLGVFNGDIGIALRRHPSDPTLRCHFLDGQGLRSVAVSRLSEVETAFAMTVHKSQGSEFRHVALVLPDADVAVLTRELLYTGVTRARSALTLLVPRPELMATAVGRQTQRVSGLAAKL